MGERIPPMKMIRYHPLRVPQQFTYWFTTSLTWGPVFGPSGRGILSGWGTWSFVVMVSRVIVLIYNGLPYWFWLLIWLLCRQVSVSDWILFCLDIQNNDNLPNNQKKTRIIQNHLLNHLSIFLYELPLSNIFCIRL